MKRKNKNKNKFHILFIIISLFLLGGLMNGISIVNVLTLYIGNKDLIGLFPFGYHPYIWFLPKNSEGKLGMVDYKRDTFFSVSLQAKLKTNFVKEPVGGS